MLGPLAVIVDGLDVTPRRAQQRVVLAMLLVRRNAIVADDDRGADPGGARPRAPRRAHRRTRAPGTRAAPSRATAGSAHARALSVGSGGGRAERLPGWTQGRERGARPRSRRATAAPRASDPRARSGTRSSFVHPLPAGASAEARHRRRRRVHDPLVRPRGRRAARAPALASACAHGKPRRIGRAALLELARRDLRRTTRV